MKKPDVVITERTDNTPVIMTAEAMQRQANHANHSERAQHGKVAVQPLPEPLKPARVGYPMTHDQALEVAKTFRREHHEKYRDGVEEAAADIASKQINKEAAADAMRETFQEYRIDA